MTETSTLPDTAGREAGELMRRINAAWLEGRPRDLLPLFHPGVVTRHPGFTGRAEGRQALVDGFAQFCQTAKVVDFQTDEPQVDVVGATAVASFGFIMLYEYQGERRRSTGRDLWVFAREGAEWLAVWRTMLDVTDEPVAS